jgi:hypothetical protein
VHEPFTRVVADTDDEWVVVTRRRVVRHGETYRWFRRDGARDGAVVVRESKTAHANGVAGD